MEYNLRARQNSDMTVEQLRKMLRAQLFRPFELYLADGRSLPVEHAEVVAISPRGRTTGVGLSDGTIEIVDLPLVTSQRPRAEGRRRTRKKRTD